MKTSKRRSGAACSPRSWDELPRAVWRWTHGAGDPLSHPQTPCSSPACRECARRLRRERTRRATVWSSAASSPCKISLSLPCWSLQQHGVPLNKAPCNPSEVLLPIHAPQELCLSTKSLKPSPNHLISISATSLSSVTFLLTTASVGFQITPSHPYLQEEFSCCPGTVLTQQKGHTRQAPGGSRKGWKSSSVPAAHLNPHQHLWFHTKNNLQHIQMPKPHSRGGLGSSCTNQSNQSARTGLLPSGSPLAMPRATSPSRICNESEEQADSPRTSSAPHTKHPLTLMAIPVAVTPLRLRAADLLNLKDVWFPNKTEFPGLL